eukprot:CAMPEP_0182805650 /NCGR_PEP_ID=MMETSP0006_2-20121128/5181_1 /TAXON_ID=97485 /ORGANISM="Prymnesium parvum, Strain Texoma1" /LENGTH=105 /DNA_ID=CAMNT_0024931217 /DNA_START=58 /DNA_END=372 /DNA_ORIENTATION=+
MRNDMAPFGRSDTRHQTDLAIQSNSSLWHSRAAANVAGTSIDPGRCALQDRGLCNASSSIRDVACLRSYVLAPEILHLDLPSGRVESLPGLRKVAENAMNECDDW